MTLHPSPVSMGGTATAAAAPAATRMHHLDWLRVIAVLAVFVHHVTVIFAGHSIVSDTTQSYLAELVVVTLKHWRMPLLFFIAGAAAYFTLNGRSWDRYLLSRSQRLLVPLVFGVLTILPHLAYYRHISHADPTLSYAEFYPRFFQAMGSNGYFTLYHLWFIAYLVLYSALLLPVFLYIRSTRGQKLLSAVGATFHHWGALLLPAIPLAVAQIVLRRLSFDRWYVIDDWAHFLFYLLIFLFGYALTGMSRFWESVVKYRRRQLIIGVALAIILPIIYVAFGSLYSGPATRFVPQMIMIALCSWCLVLAFLGYAAKYLNFSTPFMKYCADASYPFFILHQWAIIIVGFYVVGMDIPGEAKFAIVLCLSFAAVVVVYETVVRGSLVARFLFGMKVAKDETLISSSSERRLSATGR